MPEPGSSQAWNRYSYTVNNPVNYNDPTGHEAEGEECTDSAECDLEGEDPPTPMPETEYYECDGCYCIYKLVKVERTSYIEWDNLTAVDWLSIAGDAVAGASDIGWLTGTPIVSMAIDAVNIALQTTLNVLDAAQGDISGTVTDYIEMAGKEVLFEGKSAIPGYGAFFNGVSIFDTVVSEGYVTGENRTYVQYEVNPISSDDARATLEAIPSRGPFYFETPVPREIPVRQWTVFVPDK